MIMHWHITLLFE